MKKWSFYIACFSVLVASVAVSRALRILPLMSSKQELINDQTTYTTLPLKSDVVLDNQRGYNGNHAAPYTLIEFGDYECPPCRASYPFVHNLLRTYPSTLRFQFRNLPLTSIHPLALPAAQLAEEARQSRGKSQSQSQYQDGYNSGSETRD